MHRNTTHANHITVRLADYSDARELLRLAALDSTRVPDGALVVAESGHELLAALPLEGGRPIADPFHRTAALVELLELRAAQLRALVHAPRRSLAERIRAAVRLQPQPRHP
jgi:hypothetical protein